MRTTTVFLCLLSLVGAVATSASVPPMISYQGKLMQPSGATVPDGTYSMQFAIYDVPTGGTALWSETNPSVQTKGGLFATMLGSVVNLPANVFDNPNRFFGVKVGSDPEMTPRQQVASVGYAVKAGSADVATIAGNGVPVGGVLMWSGAVANIPQGWKLCDGTNGTPDLGSKFIVGVGGVDNYAVGATGGEKLHQLTEAEMPSHKHWEKASPGGTGDAYQVQRITAPYDPGGTGTNNYTTSCGGDQPHENRPPYYALCFIMKVGS